MREYDCLDVVVEARVATVYLDRPDKANALSGQLWQELQQCFEVLDARADVRTVVLAGNGRHFCAGMDLDVFAGLVPGENEDPARVAERLRRLILGFQDNLTALERCHKPVLAAIQGACVGGGLALAACADARYCSEDAFFSIKEIDIGMTADVGTLQRLPRLMPDGLVRELAYTGRRMRPDEALRCGLVNHVHADQQTLLNAVQAIARDIAGKSPIAVRGTKVVLNHARDHSVAEGLQFVATWNAGMLSRQDLLKALSGQGEAFGD